MANSEVKLKHKVQLRKKVEEPEVTVNNEDIETNNTPKHQEQKPKSWIWILLGVLVIGIIGYMFFSESGDKTVGTPDQKIEMVSESSVISDTIVVENTDVEDAVLDSRDEVVKTPDAQSSESVEIPSAVDNTSTVPSSMSNSVTNVSNDIEAEAMKVIRGDYGIGQERKDRLGSKYQTIQSRVNELKREGIF